MTARPAVATVDLQVHSTASDGSVAPQDIAPVAAAAHLSAFALTDHDSISGVAAATAAAAPLGIRVVAGVELSALHLEREVHLLGLHIEAMDALDARLIEFREQRVARAHLIVERLRALGVGVTFEDVQREAGGGAFGRPHVARAIIALGAVKDFREAFDRYLGAGRPAYVAKPMLTAGEVCALVHSTGGIVIWAHPGREGRREVLESLMLEGLDGVEILHPGHSPEDVSRLRALVEHLGLLASGGSDWHGELLGSRTLGAMQIPAEWLSRQDERVAERRSAGRA